MLIVATLYTFVGLSSALTDQTHVSSMATLLTSDEKWKSGLKTTVNFLIFVSALGVTNGMTAVLNREAQNLYNLGVWFGSPKLKARFGENGALFYILGVVGFWATLLVAISQPFQTDVLVDGLSNYPTLVFFVIYAMIIAGYWFKRKRFTSVKKINNKFF